MMNDVAEAIKRYLAKEGISRAELAQRIGVATSSINQILSGHMQPSERFLLKLAEHAGLIITPEKRAFAQFEIPFVDRAILTRLEGTYQTIRPSFRNPNQANGFLTHIEWNERSGNLTFREEGNDLSPVNSGIVSLSPHRLIYLLTLSNGNYRLAIVSYAYDETLFYGGLMTVSSAKMSERTPTAVPFVLRRLQPGILPFFGAIDAEHPEFSEAMRLMAIAREEGFFHI